MYIIKQHESLKFLCPLLIQVELPVALPGVEVCILVQEAERIKAVLHVCDELVVIGLIAVFPECCKVLYLRANYGAEK